MKDYAPNADSLLEILRILRAPGGCPWDRAQTAESFGQCFAEEAGELLDAIDRKDSAGICEESGDVLMNVFFQIILGEENGTFTVEDVWRTIIDKMIRRHAHIFGDRKAATPEEVKALWQEIKSREHAGAETRPASVMDEVKHSLSPLNRAEKIQKKAAKCGFDWQKQEEVLAKIGEELDETRQAMTAGSAEAVDEELGDLLFSVVNLIRFRKGQSSEELLRKASLKFETRFRVLETMLRDSGRKWEECSPEELDDLWRQAKENVKRKEGMTL